VEAKRKIRFAKIDGTVTEEAHTYVYITSDYAVGGVWERRDEFDNEQQRWDITLPLTSPAIAGASNVNQALFFHPGAKYKAGDDRHASPYGEVLFHKDCAIQLWKLPDGLDAKEAHQEIVGCLPKGEWLFEKQGGCGLVGDVYIGFYLMNDLSFTEKTDRISITSSLRDGLNGIVIEAVSCKEAAVLGIKGLAGWAESLNSRRAAFTELSEAGEEGKLSLVYQTRNNDTLSITVGVNSLERSINGQFIEFSDYLTGEQSL
jgi:hypothetical protein